MSLDLRMSTLLTTVTIKSQSSVAIVGQAGEEQVENCTHFQSTFRWICPGSVQTPWQLPRGAGVAVLPVAMSQTLPLDVALASSGIADALLKAAFPLAGCHCTLQQQAEF